MRKIALVISVILVVNMILGFLFQISNQVVCYTELGVLGLGGLIYWLSLYRPLQRFANFSFKKEGVLTTNFIKIGGLGIAFVVLNLLFCRFFLNTTMYTFFGCSTPASDLLDALLTNNIVGNILCYVSLVFFIIDERPDTVQKEINSNGEINVVDKTEISAQPSLHDKMLRKDFLLLTDSKKVHTKVDIASISYVVVQSNCIIIHSENRKFVKYQSLKSFHESLPQDDFIRIHRSTVVNLNFIEGVNNYSSGDGEVRLKNDVILRYSRNYKKALHPFFAKS